MDLAGLIRQLDRSLEESAIRGGLSELGENPTFLEASMQEPDFTLTQMGNPYHDTNAFVLHRTKDYMIRAVGWPVSAPERSLVYSPEHAHNHNFELYTIGYRGPGYVTDLYDIDGKTLCWKEQVELKRGCFLHYPAWTVAHTTQAPREYSISLNVLVRVSGEQRGNQFFRLH